MTGFQMLLKKEPLLCDKSETKAKSYLRLINALRNGHEPAENEKMEKKKTFQCKRMKQNLHKFTEILFPIKVERV